MWDIVFEHKDFVVINKPCGVSVHSELEEDVCLTASLAQQLGVERVWLVHRLDKATSGLLLFALNRDSAAALSAQFAEKTMRKTYLALGTHKPAKKQGWVKGGMARSRRGTWKLTRDEDNFAVTRFSSQSLKPGLRLFVLQPFTGKTHQLRVAMKS
ncbi:TIGR01621 family pseudouridine synthase, partial [Neisseria sp. P0001.S005]|uniref:TIGR01621 family pseudouridine synthase n=1 Tax=Neisseria sp. P0001.S005 TaxID=3436649 RepID=UPI003F7EE8BE